MFACKTQPPSCATCQLQHLGGFKPPCVRYPQVFHAVRSGTRNVRKGGHVMGNLSHDDEIFILYEGWAFSYKLLDDGRRQIVDFFMPGDIIGLEYLAMQNPMLEYEAITNATLCVFPLAEFRKLMARDAQIATTVAQLALRHNATLAERLLSVGQLRAVEGLGNLLLELYTRLQWHHGDCVQNTCTFPLTQTHLGDALGLTPEHINRALHQLRGEGLLEVKGRTLTIHNFEGLKRVVGWNEGYLLLS